MSYSEFLAKFLYRISPDLMEKAIDLLSVGYDEFIWKPKDALEVIDILINNGKCILGGDVYSFKNGKLIITGDNWYTEPTNYLATDSDIQRSRVDSINFINKYVERNGPNYYFSLVVDFK